MITVVCDSCEDNFNTEEFDTDYVCKKCGNTNFTVL